MQNSKIVITCSKGIPPFLCAELEALGFAVRGEGPAFVETRGTMADAMKLNLHIRTGQRVLFLVSEFTCSSPDALYSALSALHWEDMIHEDGYLCVTSSVDTPSIRNTQFANLKVKDAIVDRIKDRKGRRPDSGPERDKAVVHLHWKDEYCALYLDTSGEPLHMRGYRKLPFKAPMQETLAAAVVMAAGWKGEGAFVNPMCGSGTLAIEALLLALGRPPGLLRSTFGFMHLKGFDRKGWQMLVAEARGQIKKNIAGRVIATDLNPQAVDAARRNAAAAGVEDRIEFGSCDFAETPVPEGGGVVMLNPEYGERLGDKEQLGTVYKGIGDFFKQRCDGYTGYIFTGNMDLAKAVGLRAKRRIILFNSTIECRLLAYELYRGSRKGIGQDKAEATETV